MAEIKAEVEVSVEKIVMDGIRQVAEQVWRDHGICIKMVQLDWTSSRSVGTGEVRILGDVEVHMETVR